MITQDVRQQSLLNAFWVPINFQNSAVLTISVPAALLATPGINRTAVLAILVSIVSAITMVVPPIAGALSDFSRRRGGRRRPAILIGTVVNVAGLLWMAHTSALYPFAIALFVSYFGQSISLAAYQPLIPEVVARSHWGKASGFQGIGTLIGSVGGLAVGAVASPDAMFVITAVIFALGAITILATPEGRWIEGEHAHVGNWHDFGLTFSSRFLTNFGLTLLMTFVLFFFNDVLKFKNPSAGTGFFGGLALIGAIITSVWMGQLSDRADRKRIVALSGIPMALAILLFAFVPSTKVIALVALFFGLGYGAFLSTGWALAIDSVPKLRDAARDLGIWGVAAGLPGIIAPILGGWLLQHYASPRLGYQMVFTISSITFLLGSVVVMFVRARRTAAAS